MKLSLFTPEQPLLKDLLVQEVLAPSVKGCLGILPGHASLVTLLEAGVLKYLPEKSSSWEKLALGWGYLEVHGGDVRILAESAITKKTMDRLKVEKELKIILEQLKREDIKPSERENLEKERLWLSAELEL